MPLNKETKPNQTNTDERTLIVINNLMIETSMLIAIDNLTTKKSTLMKV